MDFNSTQQHTHDNDNDNNIGMETPKVFQDVDDVVLDAVRKEKQGTYSFATPCMHRHKNEKCYSVTRTNYRFN